MHGELGMRRMALGWALGACLSILAGCGGDGGGDTDQAPATLSAPARLVPPASATLLSTVHNGFSCASDALTCIEVQSTGTAAQASAPVTFGQAFRAGELRPGQALQARDPQGQLLPVQVDGVSTREDGSVRLAVLSVPLRDLQAGERRVLQLLRSDADTPPPARPAVPDAGLALQATLYTPQVSLLTLGDRVGYESGVPFVLGEVVTLVLSLGDHTERYAHTVDAETAGGKFESLTRMAFAFQKLIAANAASRFKGVTKEGGYERLWLTTSAPDAGPFTASIAYSGQARTAITLDKAYANPVQWTARSQAALSQAIAQGSRVHLAGPVAWEATLVVPFTNAQGQPHPQLTARVHTRLLDGGARVRHDVVMENNWAYNPQLGNLTYALTVRQGDTVLLQQPAFVHHHHARWHRVLWQGPEVQARVRHHMPYLMSTGVIWQYNLGLRIPESVLAEEGARLSTPAFQLMGTGSLTPYFGTTGGRWEIGPYPRWTALYLITQDERARGTTLAHGDLVGGIPIHYRDAATDQPLDLDTHPGVTVLFGASDPADALPETPDPLTVWSPDTAHQGSYSFVPYLLTGDVYYLDELMFWSSWNLASPNPPYRNRGEGLIHLDQVRGQAWSLRALGEAARALPDAHPMKRYFESRLANNLAYYARRYRDGGDTSPLGAVFNPYQPDAIGTWQNDFFGVVIAQLAQDGYAQARPVLDWVSRLNVGRFMHEDQGLCLPKAAANYVKLVNASGAFITDWRELAALNWPGVRCADLTLKDVDGFADASAGAAAYARAVLASAANAGDPQALVAYRKWLPWTPLIDRAFTTDPTWAIVPHWP